MSAASAVVAGIFCIWAVGTLVSRAAPVRDCSGETAALARAETELPHLDLTPPLHRALVCITLETLVDFGRRVGAHVKRCPTSPYGDKAQAIGKATEEHAGQFRQHRCRRRF